MVVGGLLSLCLFHGTAFVALRTEGELRERPKEHAGRSGIATITHGRDFLTALQLHIGDGWALVFSAMAMLSFAATVVFTEQGNGGPVFHVLRRRCRAHRDDTTLLASTPMSCRPRLPLGRE
ncbi:hypothetical protein [Streptomyces sp. NPDC002537]